MDPKTKRLLQVTGATIGGSLLIALGLLLWGEFNQAQRIDPSLTWVSSPHARLAIACFALTALSAFVLIFPDAALRVLYAPKVGIRRLKKAFEGDVVELGYVSDSKAGFQSVEVCISCTRDNVFLPDAVKCVVVQWLAGGIHSLIWESLEISQQGLHPAREVKVEFPADFPKYAADLGTHRPSPGFYEFQWVEVNEGQSDKALTPSSVFMVPNPPLPSLAEMRGY